MSDYSSQLEQVKSAKSLDEIKGIVRQFDPKSTVYDGILYSRDVGNTSSELIAKELSARTGLPIINDTPRAQFLVAADSEIDKAARRLFIEKGQDPEMAKQSAIAFRYGDDKALSGPTSLRDPVGWALCPPLNTPGTRINERSNIPGGDSCCERSSFIAVGIKPTLRPYITHASNR